MLLDKQWQPPCLDASVSPVAPHTPLKATGHPIASEANPLMLWQSTFASCASLQRYNRQADTSTMSLLHAVRGYRGRTNSLILSQQLNAWFMFSPEVEQTVWCLCNEVLLGVCWCRALVKPKRSIYIQKHPSYIGNVNSETPGNSKNLLLHWGVLLGGRHSLMLVQ